MNPVIKFIAFLNLLIKCVYVSAALAEVYKPLWFRKADSLNCKEFSDCDKLYRKKNMTMIINIKRGTFVHHFDVSLHFLKFRNPCHL